MTLIQKKLEGLSFAGIFRQVYYLWVRVSQGAFYLSGASSSALFRLAITTRYWTNLRNLDRDKHSSIFAVASEAGTKSFITLTLRRDYMERDLDEKQK